MYRMMRKHIERLKEIIFRELNGYQAQFNDLSALEYMAPLIKSYLPWSGASMSPVGIRLILNDILINKRRTIVECGAGVSTVMIANLLCGKDANFICIENNFSWMNIVQEILVSQSMDNVTFIHAPLVCNRYSLAGSYWYDVECIKSELCSPVDLLLVDGPNAGAGKQASARYPVGPELFPCLNPTASNVILHDCDRPAERRIIGLWESQFDLSFQYGPKGSGIAFAPRGDMFTIV